MSFTGYQSYRVKAFAMVHINGTAYEFDISRLQLNYSLNSVPSGTLQLALGRNVLTAAAAEIHFVAGDLTVTLPIDVFVQVTPGPNSFGFPFESWPDGYFLAFTGIITSTGYTRTRDQVSFVVSIEHWLADMHFSSALTRSTHSLTPQQLSGAAAFQFGQGVQPAFIASTLAGEFFTPAKIQRDLWGEAIGPWLHQLCQQDILSDDADANLDHNLEGLAALERFEPFIDGIYSYGIELPMALGQAGGALASAISEDIGASSFSGIESTTLWDKLIGEFAANYRFAVVPMADRALVVPAVPGMRQPWQAIYGEEYSFIDIQSRTPRPVKGVRLFSGFASPQGAMNLGPGNAGLPPTLAGKFDNTAYPDGMIIMTGAPRWAANVITPVGVGANPFGPIGGVMFPGLPGVPAQPAPGIAAANAADLWNAYARMVYITEALHSRTGSLQGKLRFDIAPGSTVAIRAVEDKFVRLQTGVLANSLLFAEVQTVTISIDSEAPSASTTFALQNVRDAIDNVTDALSIEGHPLYSSRWSGAPLVDDPAFIPDLVNPVFS